MTDPIQETRDRTRLHVQLMRELYRTKEPKQMSAQQLSIPTVQPHQNFGALVPQDIHQAIALSEVMAKASLIPEHLRGKQGDCLLIIMQAQRWGMDALSVAQCTSVVRGKLCYEGKLVAAALYAMGAIDGRLRYAFSGSGQNRSITVSARPRGENEDQTVEGSVAAWATENGQWKRDPDSMLVYRGTRQWARRYAPEALLGVYTPDEMDEPLPVATVTQMPQRASVTGNAAKPAPVPDEVVDVDPDTGEVLERQQAQQSAPAGAELSAMPGPMRKMLEGKLVAAGLTFDQLAAAHPGIGSDAGKVAEDFNRAVAWIKAQQS